MTDILQNKIQQTFFCCKNVINMCFIIQLKEIVLFLKVGHDFHHNSTGIWHFRLLCYQMSETTLINESTSLGKQTLMVIYIRSIINDAESRFHWSIYKWTPGVHLYWWGFCNVTQTCWYSNSDKEQISKNRWMALPEPSVRALRLWCNEVMHRKNHFVTFFNKLNCIYSQFSKNVRELASCALKLESGVRKIWRLLDKRWVA